MDKRLMTGLGILVYISIIVGAIYLIDRHYDDGFCETGSYDYKGACIPEEKNSECVNKKIFMNENMSIINDDGTWLSLNGPNIILDGICVGDLNKEQLGCLIKYFTPYTVNYGYIARVNYKDGYFQKDNEIIECGN